MNLILIRHGLTEANIKHITNGHLDDMLSVEGRAQAIDLVNQVKNYDFDVIYSSPLKRATETALPIAEATKKNIEIDRRLIEVDFGKYTGLPYDAIEKEMGRTGTQMLNDYDFNFPEGESSTSVEKRVRSFISDLKTMPYENVLVVTHGGIIRWFYYVLENKKIGPLQNASIHEFTI